MKLAGGLALHEYDAARVKTWLSWSGRILSAFGVLICLSSIFAKLTHDGGYVREWQRLGFSESILTGVGLVQLSGIVLYLIPSTSVLGTVVMTGYLGGATATHVRVSDTLFTIVFPGIVGLLIWGGLYLRDARLRELVPLRS